MSPDTIRILRHLVATIAYRASRSLRDAPPRFEDVRLSDNSMCARELVLHITNVLAFALSVVTQTERVRHEPLDWNGEVNRLYGLLHELDANLASGSILEDGMELKLIQGPLADSLTHIGQLNSMRRASGSPIPVTNYIKADLQIGRTALNEQS